MNMKTEMQDSTLKYGLGFSSPTVDKVWNQKVLSNWNRHDTIKLSINLVSLLIILYMYLSGILHTFQHFIQLRVSSSLSKFMLPMFLYAIIALLSSNILSSIIKYYQKQPDFASVELSPHQRKALGLRPIVDGNEIFNSTAFSGRVSSFIRSVNKLDQASPLTRRVAPTISSTIGHESHSPFTTRSAPTPFQTSPQQPPPPNSTSAIRFTPVSGTKSVTSPFSSFLLGRSPIGLGHEPIRDLKHLDAVLGSKENIMLDPPHSPPAEFVQTAPFQPTPPQLGKIQSASRTSKGPAQPTQVRKENGLYMYEPSLVLQELNIDDYIETWTEKMRKWMSAKVLNQLLKRIENIDNTLRETNLSHLDTRTKSTGSVAGVWAPHSQQAQSGPTATGGLFKPAVSTFGGSTSIFSQPETKSHTTGPFGLPFGSATPQNSARPSTLEELFAAYYREPIVQERMKLERYLTVPGQSTNRLYVLERIRALSKGGVLGAYQWCGGAEWMEKPWSRHKDLPSDALLLVHIFATFMDETITPWDEYGRGEAFSRRHLTLFELPSSDPMASIHLRLADPNPPTLQLIVNYDTPKGVEKRGWQIFPKRNNLFHALSIFVYYVKVTAGGFLGVADLGSKTLDLLQVVEPQPSYSPFLAAALPQGGSRRFSNNSPHRGSVMLESIMTPIVGKNHASTDLTPSAISGSIGIGGMIGSGGLSSSASGTPLPNPFVAPRSGGIRNMHSGGNASPDTSKINIGNKSSEVNSTPFGTPTPVPGGFNMSSLGSTPTVNFTWSKS